MSERIEIKGAALHRRELVVDPLRAEAHPAIHGIAWSQISLGMTLVFWLASLA